MVAGGVLVLAGWIWDIHIFKSVISFQGFIGYVCGVSYSFGSAFYTQIAVHTSVLFIALTTAVLVSWSDEGFMSALAGEGVAGRVGRKLLVYAVTVPPLVNLIQLEGAKLGWFDNDFGVLLRVVGNVVLSAWMAFQTGLYLSETDAKRALAEQAQQKLLIVEREAREEAEMERTHQVKSRQRIERLQSVTAALAKAMDVQQVGDILLEGGVEALRTGEALFIETEQELLARFPLIAQVYAPVGPRDFVALPIKLDDRVIAAAGFGFAGEMNFDTGTRDYAMAIAGQCGLALERAFLFARERARAVELEKALRARDDLLSICSHELRTPVTSMRLQAQLTKPTSSTSRRRSSSSRSLLPSCESSSRTNWNRPVASSSSRWTRQTGPWWQLGPLARRAGGGELVDQCNQVRFGEAHHDVAVAGGRRRRDSSARSGYWYRSGGHEADLRAVRAGQHQRTGAWPLHLPAHRRGTWRNAARDQRAWPGVGVYCRVAAKCRRGASGGVMQGCA